MGAIGSKIKPSTCSYTATHQQPDHHHEVSIGVIGSINLAKSAVLLRYLNHNNLGAKNGVQVAESKFEEAVEYLGQKKMLWTNNGSSSTCGPTPGSPG